MAISYGEIVGWVQRDDYGAAAYRVVEEVMGSETMRDAISPAVQARIGGLYVAAYGVAQAAQSGDMPALLDAGISALMGVAAQIAGDAFTEVAPALPIIGAVFGAAFNIADAVASAEARAAEEAARKWREECRATMLEHRVRPTGGSGGEPMPADLFVQSFRVAGHLDEFVSTDRVPFTGGMLRLLTEYQWPLYFVDEAVFDRQRLAKLLGIPFTLIETLSEQPSPQRGYCVTPQWPASEFPPLFRALRVGIEDQSIGRRRLAGRPDGDGGASLWPLWQDLFWAYTSVPRWPLIGATDATAAAAGLTKVPAMPAGLAGRLFRPFFNNFPWAVWFYNNLDTQGVYGGPRYGDTAACAEWRDYYADLYRIAGSCHGDVAAGLNGAYEMAADWRNTVDPLYAQSQERLEREIADVIVYTDEYASAQLPKTADAATPAQTLQLLERIGADRRILAAAAPAANDGMSAGAAAALALVAGGGYLLSRRR